MTVKDTRRWRELEDGTWVRAVGIASEEGINPAEVNATKGAIDAALGLGVDITQVEGTGKDGKVTKADVEASI